MYAFVESLIKIHNKIVKTDVKWMMVYAVTVS